jgi:sugar (pentulose or hexulose) kinase
MTDTTILVTAGYGANTKRPFVMMQADVLDRPLQLSVAEARDLAGNLLQAAEAAEGDQLIVEFATDTLGFEVPEAAQLIIHMRELRKKNRKP